MKNTYIYPAIFNFYDNGVSVTFPDFEGCLPCGETLDEAVKNAKEALGLHIYGMEQDEEIIPEPSDVRFLKSDSVIMLIDVYMPVIRDKISNRFVKKTLSLPYWLNAKAEQENVNFSAILQDALKNYLHL